MGGGVAQAAPPPSPGEFGENFAALARRFAGVAGAVLGWSPDAFWRATPAELAGVLAVLSGEAVFVPPPDAAVIARLMEAFPDG